MLQYEEEYKNNIDDRYTNTDASESGIIKFFEKTESIDIIRAEYPLHESGPEKQQIAIPFNSDLKWTPSSVMSFFLFLAREKT